MAEADYRFEGAMALGAFVFARGNYRLRVRIRGIAWVFRAAALALLGILWKLRYAVQ
jgi:hypothetical protein